MVDRPPTPVPPDVSKTLLVQLARPRADPDRKYRELQPYKKSRWRDFALNSSMSAYRTWAKYATWCVSSILKQLRERHFLRRRLAREVHAKKLRALPGRVKGLKEAFSRSLMPPRNGHSIIHPLCWFNSKGGSYIPESFRELPLRRAGKRDPTGYQSKLSVSSSQQVTPVSRPSPPNLRGEQIAATGAAHGAVPRVPRSQTHFEPGAASSTKPPTASPRTPVMSSTQRRTNPPRKPPSDGEFAEAFLKALQKDLSSFDAALARREALLQAGLLESVTEVTRKREESPPVRIPKPNYNLMKEGPPPARPDPSGGGERVWCVPGWYEPSQPPPAVRPPAPRAGGTGWAARTRQRRSTAAWKNCPCNSHPNSREPPTPPPAHPRTYVIHLPLQDFKSMAAALARCIPKEDHIEDTENNGMTLEEALAACKINEDPSENTENDNTQPADEAANEQPGRRRRRRRRRRGKKAAEDANEEPQQEEQQ